MRPLDVGGPLGEAERIVSDIQIAEKKRAQEKSTSGAFVRPMDASVKGPLGEAEEGLVTLVESLKSEEVRDERKTRVGVRSEATSVVSRKVGPAHAAAP